MTHKKPVRVLLLSLPSTKSVSPAHYSIELPRVDYEKLSGDRLGETSASIRQRVQAARDIQNKRFADGESSNFVYNADMCVGEIRQFCKLQDEGQGLMRAEMT